MNARVLVNGKAVELISVQAAIAQPEKDVYHVLIDGRSFEIRVSGDRMDVNGHELHVVFDDPRDAPLVEAATGVSGRQSITAPMPGKVVRILVAEDDTVERGQGIVVIEAMKMQNVLKSPKTGRVASMFAKQGMTVALGEILAVVD